MTIHISGAALLIVFFALAGSAWAQPPPLTNQLQGHASPYLALHGEDPVAWQDWSKEAVARARASGKLLYLSIGYFSCHWCHVMQRESYRNPEIAAYLNKHFIPVKVDRELQTALDARLIAFAEATRGISGWPLNVFITPDGHPLYAVLYSPPTEFLEILKKLQSLWTTQRSELMKLARDAAITGKGPGKPALDKKRIKAYETKLIEYARALGDPVSGGFGEQSKFPSAPQLLFLLDYLSRHDDRALREFMQLTLDQMADQGLYDHIGDGFFRYTVDPGWRTPHFEKMLYDNALLVEVYLKAASVLKNPGYKGVATRTLDFMLRDMRSRNGAMIAALSALDDKGVEGGYYLWSEDELGRLLSKQDKKITMMAWGMMDAPPFEDGYLPVKGDSIKVISKSLKVGIKRIRRALRRAQKKLTKARMKRRLPRDNKILAGWNGLALTAFAEGARATGRPEYQQAAQEIRDYLVNILWDGKTLKRAVVNKSSVGKVSLEDYAFVAKGLLAYANLSQDKKDLAMARRVVDQAWQRFYSKHGWRLSRDSLIKTEDGQDAIADGSMPSPSGVIMSVSLELARRDKDTSLMNRTLSALNSGHESLRQEPFWFASHIAAMISAR